MPRLTHKRGRPSAYRLKLRTSYWEGVARQVRIRDGHRCRECGDTVNLEVHHTTYYIDGQSIVGHEAEHLDKLVTLCASCHAKQHQNKH